MAKLTFYGGINEIGGNKVLVEDGGGCFWTSAPGASDYPWRRNGDGRYPIPKRGCTPRGTPAAATLSGWQGR